MPKSTNNPITQLTHQVLEHLSQSVVSQKETLLLTLTCLVAGGHLLLEDLPGVGKTTLAKALANCMDGEFRRVQCTPDLMPSDITGVTVYNQQSGQFEFMPGPVFTHILLADEINRTSPRTQSALLEAMSDATVSIDNQTHALPDVFFVIATQNPIEFSGTYALPEAQMDRFMMRLSLGYPSFADEVSMLKQQTQQLQQATSENGRTHEQTLKPALSQKHVLKLRRLASQVKISDELYHYVTQVTHMTRQHPQVRLGASPRATLSLIRACQAYALLTGANSVTPAHVQKLAMPVLAHRLQFRDSRHTDAQRAEFFTQILSGQVSVPDHPNAMPSAIRSNVNTSSPTQRPPDTKPLSLNQHHGV